MQHAKDELTFDDACEQIETALKGTIRQEILADLSKSSDLGEALHRLRERMRSNLWIAGAHEIRLGRTVKKYDDHTRREGFHVLHDWDGKADSVNPDTIAVDVLNYLVDKRGAGEVDGTVLAILLDYYFLYLLALLSLRVWDDGDADGRLDRLDQLLRDLQGPHGSGQRFADNAGTLILIATAHYELHERGFATLLAKVRTLNRSHRTNVAFVHAACLASHLRFGFEASYGRDIVTMRNDNVADYPWLSFSLATLMKEYARMHDEGIQGRDRETIVEALLNGLSPDARAFVGTHPPSSLSGCEVERTEFCELFHGYRDHLLEECERHRPSDRTYSPISFFFNFSHNVLKGTVVDALLRAKGWNLALNDLLTGIPQQETESKQALANTLMGYARSSPDRIRGRLVPVIVYDPRAGRRAFTVTMRKLRA
jgi:hypothetical protein